MKRWADLSVLDVLMTADAFCRMLPGICSCFDGEG